MWATPAECWVGGKGGLYRCVIGEEPQRVNPRSVHQGAVIGEHFLACPSGTTWSLYTAGNEPVVVDVPDGYVRSIAVDGESFVVLIEQLHADIGTSKCLIRVNVSGDVTIGPELPTIPGRRGASPYLAGTPLRIFRSGTASRVLADLTLGSMEQLDGDPFHGGQVGNFVWIIDHLGYDPAHLRWVAWAVTLFAGLTMVSNLKYYSFKSINLRKSVPFVAIFLIVLVLALLSYQPAIVLFAAFVAYGLSGYGVSAWMLLRERRVRTAGSR